MHGVRFNNDLSYQALINELLRVYPAQLNYIPVVRREEPLQGLSGRITNAIESNRLFEYVKLVPKPSNAQFMIWGNPQMVKDTTALLLDKNFTRNRRKNPGNITVEQYW